MVAAVQEKKARFSRSKFLKSREWSSYQQALFGFGLEGSGHGIVNAVAGSGKSTSLVGLVASLPATAKIAVVAFNNHSVADLAAKMPSTISVSTAHKFGMSALFRFFGEPFKPNDEKMRGLCRGAISALVNRISDEDYKVAEFPEMDLLVNGIKSKNRVIASEAKVLQRSCASYLDSIIHFAMASLSPLNVEALIELENYFCVEFDFSVELAHAVLLPLVEDMISKAVAMAIDKKDVSLDELLYLPVRLQLGFPAYDFVLQDEAQDASNVMMAMIGRMASNGRLISVGDKFQSIQGFTGAAADSFDRIAETFNPTQLDLSICYRCPSSHLDLARRLVPGIRNKPDAPMGTIAVVSIGNVARSVRLGDLMLCRFTAPLVSTCLELIGRGIKARVRGRDIGSQLTALVERVVSDFPDSFSKGLNDYCLPRLRKMKEDEQDDKAQSLEDRMMAVNTCFESFGFECRSREDFCRQILALFCDDDDQPPVTLATIHRSKGDEADRVWILGSDFLPFTKKSRHEWQVQQELNLTYVALTRSKSDLFLVPIGKNAETMLKHPLGGLCLPKEVKSLQNIAPVEVEPLAAPKTYTREQQESIARIEERFAAMDNSTLTIDPTVRIQKSAQLFTVPPKPEQALEVGMLVAVNGNPANAAKVVAIEENRITVQRGQQEPVTVDRARVKVLIPVVI